MANLELRKTTEPNGYTFFSIYKEDMYISGSCVTNIEEALAMFDKIEKGAKSEIVVEVIKKTQLDENKD